MEIFARIVGQSDGKTITEIYPTQWKIADAARMLEAASKLGRLAVGEETERIGVNARMIEVTADDLVQAAREVSIWGQNLYGNGLPNEIN